MGGDMTATDANGKTVDMDAAAILMDDELREDIAITGEFDEDPSGFLAEYAKRHEAKFGEPFAPYVGGAW